MTTLELEVRQGHEPVAVDLICETCGDRRRLPRNDAAVRWGVPAFLDEHAGCGGARIVLPG